VKTMKTLVAYYSLTGQTRALAEAIASRLDGGAVLDEIKPLKPYGRVTAYVFGRADVVNKKIIALSPAKRDASAFDALVLLTPIWASNFVPPIRAFVHSLPQGNGKPCVLCITYGGNYGSALDELPKLLEAKGYAVRAKIAVKNGEKIDEAIAKTAAALAAPVLENAFA